MSLLMKALEKAAQDRAQADGTPSASTEATATAGAGNRTSELTLEPVAPPAAARDPSRLPPKRSTDSTAASTGSYDSAQAAALLRASHHNAGGGVGSYVQEHPLMILGAVGVLFLMGYGAYVYMQLAAPATFMAQPARGIQSPPSAPIAQAPLATASNQLAAPQIQAPLTSLLPALQPSAAAEGKLPARSVRPISDSDAPASAVPAAVPPAKPAAREVRDTIKVTAGGATPVVNPTLTDAYQALNSGNFDLAQRNYNQLLKTDPSNTDALLGLAAIATQQGDSEQASKYYIKLLGTDPHNALAQAGLIGMLGRADPLAAETRLKQLIAQDPSAYLYFTLGNVYADQNRWPDAQQAYFQAHYLQPENPDYAYNLAVGLEHIGQPKPALSFYRRAVQAAATMGRANFSTSAAQERISKLEKAVE